MVLEKMYPPQKDSPSTYLAGDVGTDDIYIIVGSAEVLPQSVPFPLTLGFDKSYTETVIVTDLGNGNNQLTVKRGSQPLAWIAGTKCARVFTADDLVCLQDNIGIIAEQTEENSELLEKVVSDILKHETAISKNTTAIAAEVTRATDDLNDEKARATEEEQRIDSALRTEIERAIIKDNNLNTAITDEIARAKEKEETLQNNINNIVVFSPTRPTGSWTLWLQDLGEIPDFSTGGNTPLELITAPLDSPGDFAVEDEAGAGETVVNMTDNPQTAGADDIIPADN